MYRLIRKVLLLLLVLISFNFSNGCNSDVIDDLVRRLEYVERSNAVLRQNDLNLRRIIRRQQKDIQILQRTLYYNTRPELVQKSVYYQNEIKLDNPLHDNLVVDNFRQGNVVVNERLQDEISAEILRQDKVVLDSPRQDNIVVDNFRQDEMAFTDIPRQGKIAVDDNRKDKMAVTSTSRQSKIALDNIRQYEMSVTGTSRQGKKAVDKLRQDIIKDMFVIKMAFNSNNYGDERTTRRKNNTQTEYMSFLTPKDAPKEEIIKKEQGLRRMFRSAQSNSESIAFHATINRGDVTLLANQIIGFDIVGLNLGNGYHRNAGLFIAPKSGLYIFSVSLLSYKRIKVSLKKNGEVVANVYCNGKYHTEADQGSVTAVMDLKLGDEVFVKLGGSAEAVTTIYGDSFTSFTGILLKEL